MQQRRFAAVGVSDYGDHREGDAPPSLARQGALLADFFDFSIELADAMADASPIAFQFLLARAAGADAGAQAGKIATALQPWEQVVQLRGLHLETALLGAGALGEDVQDQLGAVDHLDLELFLQVALLPR